MAIKRLEILKKRIRGEEMSITSYKFLFKTKDAYIGKREINMFVYE